MLTPASQLFAGIREIFQVFDTNNDKQLDITEVMHAFSCMVELAVESHPFQHKRMQTHSHRTLLITHSRCTLLLTPQDYVASNNQRALAPA
jgi:hypothetical protein